MSRADVVTELHKPARRNFKRRRVIVKGIDDLWQADLVDMKPYSRFNAGNKYLLVVIDVLSKYAWVEPVLTKSAKHVTRAFEKILEQGRVPRNLQTDDGKEFFNSDFKAVMNKYNINHYSTYSTMKASVVERLNRTLKEKMWKRFSLQGNYKYLKMLPEIVTEYNNTVHSTTNMKPKDVNKKMAKELLKTIYSHIKIAAPGKFKIGDDVRISKYKNLFAKGYTPNWTTEIFKIIKIKKTNPATYLLQDGQGQPIAGSFYEHELQRTSNPDVYLVERVIKRRGDNIFVKWLGFDIIGMMDISNTIVCRTS